MQSEELQAEQKQFITNIKIKYKFDNATRGSFKFKFKQEEFKTKIKYKDVKHESKS